jgi:hypothetical protein
LTWKAKLGSMTRGRLTPALAGVGHQVIAALGLSCESKINERRDTLKRIQLILLAAMALSVFGSMAASSAFAEGPLWLVTGERFDCEATSTGTFKTLLECLGGPAGGSEKWELKTLTGTSGKLKLDQGALALAYNLGVFKLVTSLITIECTTLHSPTTLVGGTPGKDHAKIVFTGCTVAGRTETECHVKSPGAPGGNGEIVTSAKTELVYIGTKAQAQKEEGPLGDLFEPESGNVFVTLEVGGTNCPIFSAGTNKVEGKVVGGVEPVESMGTEGMLNFPQPPIKTAYRWLKKGEVETLKPALEVFGFVEAEQVGLADVKLKSGEEWGVLEK